MMDTQGCETPMSDHVRRFWEHLTNEHVLIQLDLRRDTSSVIYWDGSSFSDDVAKALVAERNALLKALEVLLNEATSFSVSGVYFDEECMGHKGPALARAALDLVGRAR